MILKTLPGTDLKVSQLCLGTNRFGTSTPEQEAFALLDTFYEQGGNFLDTALVYANWLPDVPESASEKTIGSWLRSRELTGRIVVATKGGHPDLATPQVSRLSAKDLAGDIEKSLSHLQVDAIDVFWLHRDNPEVPVADILGALNQAVERGYIRYFGPSNWHAPRIREALEYARGHGLKGFVANQPMWSLAAVNEGSVDANLVVFDDDALALHRESGLAVIPYSAQAQGFFSKLTASQEIPEGVRQRYMNDLNLKRSSRLEELAQRYSIPNAHIVLSYLTSQSIPVVPVVGCRTLAQLSESMAAVHMTLTSDELEYLQAK